jgi:cell division transport system permease protein
MKAKINKKPTRRRIFSSYLTSAVSVIMVLFLIGLLALVIINTRHLTDYVREKIGFTLVLHEGLKEVEITRLQKLLHAAGYVKTTRYVNKETAEKELREELGEDFSGFLGYNPLFSSIDVKLYAQYTHSDSLAVLENKFLEFPQIKEVYYQRNLVTLINKNLSKISLFLLFFSSLLMLLFFALINNTIRMSIYSQRFIIHTMQLVGATRRFIRNPFVLKSVIMGVVGAVIAYLLIFFILYAYQKELSGLFNIANFPVMGAVFLIILLSGIIITYVSTWFAVNKFLRMKFDELFY